MALTPEEMQIYKDAGIEVPGSEGTEESKSPSGLTMEQRFIVQNIFDTQPKRRNAYLKKLGYEMNPDNDNEYRPIGSKEDFEEIDPGFFETYTPETGELVNLLKKGEIKEIGKRILKTGKETVQDIGDVAIDLGAGSATTAALAAAGPLTIPAMFLGGAALTGGTELIKKEVGDLLLDEDVPANYGSMAFQSLMSGALPVLFKGGKVAAKEAQLAWIKARKDAVIEAAKKSGGGLNEKIINRAIEKPELFSSEATKGATARLTDTYRNIFGIDDPLRIGAPEQIRGGMFGKAMEPLNEAAEKEMEFLTRNREADISFDEISAPLRARLAEYNQKQFGRSEENKAAYSYLKDQLGDLKKMLTSEEVRPTVKGAYNEVVSPEDKIERIRKMTFKEARDWLSARQGDVLSKDTAGNFTNKYGNELASTFNSNGGVLSVLNKKAEKVGSTLPGINQDRSRIFTAYQTASDKLKPSNIERAFIGDDTIVKNEIRNATAEMDKILGTNLTKDIETGAMQRVIENMYSNPKGFGSGRVNTEMVAQGIEGGVKGLLGGGAAGGMVAGKPGLITGGIIGGAAGAARGVKQAADLASPEKALEFIRQQSSRATGLEQELGGTLAESIKKQTLGMPTEASTRSFGTGATSSDLPDDDDDIDPEVKAALGL